MVCGHQYTNAIPVQFISFVKSLLNFLLQILKGDDDINIVVLHGKDQRPEKSVLTLPSMRTEWEGRYSCHVWCATLMETGTITLTISPGEFMMNTVLVPYTGLLESLNNYIMVGVLKFNCQRKLTKNGIKMVLGCWP